MTEFRGLIIDWGGVLTTDVRSAFRAWAEEDGIDIDAFKKVMGSWLGGEAEVSLNPVHALERGELEVVDFERRLAEELTAHGGRVVEPDGLLGRLFECFRAAPDMAGLVRRARAHGIRTALLSNSWGNDYPEHLFDGMFDAIVISGEVGMRKPEQAIYLHTLDQIGLSAAEAVFVDDFPHNVAAAVDLGMVGVHHVSYEATAAELEAIFGLPLG